MKIRFVYPKFKKFLEDYPVLREELREHVVGDYTMPPSLALPVLAALTPAEIAVSLTDENVEAVDFDEKVDLVAISCFTPQAQSAYRIADEFRARGTRTVLGGIHPSALPDEALGHADAVCIGEGELVWKRIIDDAGNGTLLKRYQAPGFYPMEDSPIPLRSIFKKENYRWHAHLVQVMRGCPVRCVGCPVPYMGGTLFRYRPVDRIVADIRGMPYREFYFTDDTVMLPGKRNMKFMLSLMERTREIDNIGIFLASTMMMPPEAGFYRELYKGHTSSIYTVFGFDRVSRRLFDPSCTPEEWRQGVDLVRMIEDAGIHFFASFGIGFDTHDRGTADRILKFAHDARIDLAEFYIPTPFPGTPLGTRMEQEGRLLHRNYSLWNHANVTFRPKNFTEQQLLDAFFWLWREFYKDKKGSDTVRSFQLNAQSEGRGK